MQARPSESNGSNRVAIETSELNVEMREKRFRYRHMKMMV